MEDCDTPEEYVSSELSYSDIYSRQQAFELAMRAGGNVSTDIDILIDSAKKIESYIKG